MPFDTFLNLKIEKQKKVIESSKDEFAEKGYQKASIDNIAKLAGISKGSMYQYFVNKKELYLYLYEEGIKTKLGMMESILENKDNMSFFDFFEKVLIKGLQFGKQEPKLYIISKQTDLPKDIQMSLMKLYSNPQYNKYSEIMNGMIKRGIDSKEIRSDISYETIYYLTDRMMNTLSDYINIHFNSMDENEIKNHVRSMIIILKEGIKNNNN